MMDTSAVTDRVRRTKRLYGLATLLFTFALIVDLLFDTANYWKLAGSLLLATGWFLLFYFYPLITPKRRYLIIGMFAAAMLMLVARYVFRS